ncbi:Uncharacterised protein [Mycobacteroides abscessus subsp. abscessus]|nr:Uncharacterised protein [Mycobacteroides abscessus subsp. abscessus]
MSSRGARASLTKAANISARALTGPAERRTASAMISPTRWDSAISA